MLFRSSSKVMRITAALFSAAVLLAGCAREVTVTESVRFAVFGNTAPASPFSGFTSLLDNVISGIEAEKPEIVIHTGDAIYGGSESDGINERDVRRQYRLFFSSMKNLHSVFYTMPGDRDLFNGDSIVYAEYSGRKAWYSFNYGTIHFITLYTSISDDRFIDAEQMEWLKKDLAAFSGSSAVFVLMHRPFLSLKKKGVSFPVPDDLHKLFADFRVKAVISGGEKLYSSSVYDSVRYIQAGCSGFIDEKENRRTNQFYVVNYSNAGLDVKPVRINFPKKY